MVGLLHAREAVRQKLHLISVHRAGVLMCLITQSPALYAPQHQTHSRKACSCDVALLFSRQTDHLHLSILCAINDIHHVAFGPLHFLLRVTVTSTVTTID